MKLGINVPYTDHIPREMVVAYVQEADRLGYDKVWVAEAYGWDAFTILAMLAWPPASSTSSAARPR